jgi:hypothetical protein
MCQEIHNLGYITGVNVTDVGNISKKLFTSCLTPVVNLSRVYDHIRKPVSKTCAEIDTDDRAISGCQYLNH